MINKTLKHPDTKSYQYVVSYLDSIGVSFRDIAEIALQNQEKYSNKPLSHYEEIVERVLHKRELLNHIMTMAFLDEADAEGWLPEPLRTIIHNDLGTFGVDEGMALSGASIFGTLATTNYAYLDKTKPLKIGELDALETPSTFADDIIGMIASAVIAHSVHQTA